MIVRKTGSIRDAIDAIDTSGAQIAIVVDEAEKVVGSITDGDVRRGILRGLGLESSIDDVMNANPVTVDNSFAPHDIADLMRARRIRQVPEIDQQGRFLKLHRLEDFSNTQMRDNLVVLMAGGLGTRLGEITRDRPKPLVDVGGRPLLETIISRFIASGFRRFALTVNYKAEMIEEYFGNGSNLGIDIQYIRETSRTGTSGSLTLLPERPLEPFFVMNSDVLTRVDLRGMLETHVDEKAAITMCVREVQQQIQFGVVDLKGKAVVGLREKPVYSHFINAGIYILSPEALDVLPDEGGFFDMPDLIQLNIDKGRHVTPFLVHEYWRDVGSVDSLTQAREEYTDQFE